MANARSNHVVRTVLGLGLCGALLGASGCVLGRNSDSPVLSIDLLWDKSASSHFSEGTCDSANVSWMEWKLKDAPGHVVRANDADNTDCQPGMDFFDLDPGTYTLAVTGYDSQDAQIWASKCTKLALDRFDTLYECQIDQTP